MSPTVPEAYRLHVSSEGVRINAAAERGAFYGVMTLLQLVARGPGGDPVVMACSIDDWPDFPWRGLNRGAPSLTPQWMARRKASRAEHVDAGQIDEWRRHGIEPVLHRNITHYPYNKPGLPDVLRNPNYAEGIGRTDRLTLPGETPTELPGRNVLRTEQTDIVVTSPDGKTTYVDGRDYRVIAGELKMSSRQPTSFLRDAKPFAIARLDAGRIADGATVNVTYEHIEVGHNLCGELCLAETAPQKAVAERVGQMVAEHNLSYFGLHVSESPRGVGKGPRCKATGLTASQLLGRYYADLDRAIKQANPRCRIITHADDFLPWQHAQLADTVHLLPKDSILSSWMYSPSKSVMHAYKTARLADELDLALILIPFYDYRNIHIFAAGAKWARDCGIRCLGLSDWAYHLGPNAKLQTPAPFIEEALCVAWHVPRRGERGYVDFEAELNRLGLRQGE